MNDTEQKVLESLRALDEAVASMRSGAPVSLIPLFERVDGLTRDLPRATDPTLLHYLHKRSYQKARLYLEGREAENQAGNCRHG